ncbi:MULTISPECIES: hypothetical protein [unclassified Nostoc]|uniref:hypothetical protein n=1 Tax=Nostoc sp. UCD121 TaxID=2681305 RepID=UPI0021AB292A|nr:MULTISPECIES: hypothetical protein [unclassified Nostoc]
MTDETIDLTNCDREPIHIPNLIQPHGVLLVLQDPTLEIILTFHGMWKRKNGSRYSIANQFLFFIIFGSFFD